jgi:DNA-binding MarR family transcriptional regulator
MAGKRKRNPKGYSEPIIMRALLRNPMTVSQLEKATEIKKPTIYLSLNRLYKLGYVKSDKARRNRKFYLTPVGRKAAMNRIKAEKLLSKVMKVEMGGRNAARQQESRKAGEVSFPATGFDVLTFNSFAMTEFLVKLLGKWHLERLIVILGKDETVRESVKRALESITTAEPVQDHPPLGVAPRDAVQAGVVLLSLFFENPRNPAIGILAQSLDKLLSPYLVKR